MSPKALSSKAQSHIDRKDITRSFTIEINDVVNSKVISYSQDFSYEFGIATLQVEINNNNGLYSPGCASEIKIGSKVVLKERFYGTGSDEFTNFTGYIRQREINRRYKANTITLTCLDGLCRLEETDIEIRIEADKIQVSNETLAPVYLPEPNESLASIFNFAHEALAVDPPIGIVIRNQDTNLETPLADKDGYELNYETGQLVMGSAINALYNYDVICKSYYFYPIGQYAEDVLEDIITAPDAYGKYLFEETSIADVITNHLTETFSNIEGISIDTLVPNDDSETKSIRTTLTTAYVAGATSIIVDDTSGFPTLGTGEINGDYFTWTNKTFTTLTGIPAAGEYSLKAHPIGANVIYETSYAAGRVWYLTYSNHITVLTSDDFTITPNVGATVDYIDQRGGHIILSAAVSLNSTVTCDVDYTFKTLQATNIEIDKIDFTYGKTENRFDAVRKVKEYLAPNYLIRTTGSDKIWASYVKQKTIHDYEIQLKENLSYAEDTDIYTHVKFHGRAQNPTNVCLEENVTLLQAGEEYSAQVNDHELAYVLDEKSFRIYTPGLTAAGWISTETIEPVVRINGVPIDNQVHEVLMQEVKIIVTTKTTTKTGCHGVSSEQYSKSHTNYYYKVYLPGTNVVRDAPIYFYNSTGVLLYTIGPDSPRVNYEAGIWSPDSTKRNITLETISTATFSLNYSSSKLVIDFDNVIFKVSKDLIPDVNKALVTADFEYYTTITPIDSAGNLFDARFDTQTQTIFYVKPPPGYVYAILDLGQTQPIQAIDITHGFFKPDDKRTFEINNKYTIQYSTDNINYYTLCKEAINFNLAGGEAKSFEQEQFGEEFEARYFKLIINDMNKIEYGNGIYVAAFTEFAAYKDIILTGEALLIPTTALSTDFAGDVQSGAGSQINLNVASTSYFDDYGTAYLDDIAFTYGDTTSTSFLQCSGAGIYTAQSLDTRVSQTVESDTSIYDDEALLPYLGDKLYKEIEVNEFLDTRTKIDRRAKDYLIEFYKNHTRCTVSSVYAPHVRVAQTLLVNDPINQISRRYFVESLQGTKDGVTIGLAYYP